MNRPPLPEGKVVAPRNDPNPLEPYAQSKSTQIKNLRPGRTYEWFRKDQLTVKLNPHEIGDAHTGYLMVDGWNVENVEGGVKLERGRDDAGKAVDTVLTNGELILCSTPDENYAKYAVIERKRDALIEKRLVGGEKKNFGSKTSFKTRTAGGYDGLEASASDILQGVA